MSTKIATLTLGAALLASTASAQSLYVLDGIGGLVHELTGPPAACGFPDGPVAGVIGKKAVHLIKKEDRDNATKVTDLWIDIRAKSKDEALALWDERPDGGTLSLVVGGPRARVAVTSTADRDTWTGAVRSVAQTDGPMDLDGAMTLADGGRTLIFAKVRQSEDEIMMVDLGR